MTFNKLHFSFRFSLCSVSLYILAIVLLAGGCLGVVNGEVSSRLRIHAIPVALSVLYYGKENDKTAYKSIAYTFQGSSESTQYLIERYSKGEGAESVKSSGEYVWVADDRGLADAVMIAFTLFGPDVSSIYFFIIGLMCVTFSLVFYASRHWEAGLVGLCAMLGGVVTFIYAMPVSNFSDSTSLTDPRALDFIAIFPIFYFISLCFGFVRISRERIVIGLILSFLLIFLVTVRSTVLFGLLIVLTGNCASLAWWGFGKWTQLGKRIVGSGNDAGAAGRVAFPVVCVVFIILASHGYQKLNYSPETQASVRTVWHNILMGIGDAEISPALAIADDRAAIDAVVGRYNKNNPDTEWNTQNILNSLGGHNEFNWKSYERNARELFMDLWAQKPYLMIRWYLYKKPKFILNTFREISNRTLSVAPNSPGLGAYSSCTARLSLWHWPVLLAFIVLGFLMRRRAVPGLGTITSLFALGAFVYLVPALIFYPILPAMAASIILGSAACFIVLAAGVARLVGSGRTDDAC